MTHRSILFGYRVRNGNIVVDSKAADTVIQIYTLYVSGNSLADIARTVSAGNVAYSSGSSWNKMCVKRILENEKYKGYDIYPQIVSDELFAQAAEMRLYKSKEFGYRKSNSEIDKQPVAAAFSIASTGIGQPVNTVEEIYSAAQARYAEIQII